MNKYDYAFFWDDTTIRESNQTLDQIIQSGIHVINKNCDDISKHRVEEVFAKVFEYSSLIDPTSFNGKCVQKSDSNGKHDGKILNCPIPQSQVKKDSVYQLFLEYKIDENTVYDIRVTIINYEICLTIIRYRPFIERFNIILKTIMVEKEMVFSPDEIVRIEELCRLMDLEYGEVDIIRNSLDFKIYIIDVNNTPTRMEAKYYTPETRKFYRKSLEKSFIKMIKGPAVNLQ